MFLAATWMKPIHKSKGKSIAATLGVRTDYITNEKKTAPLTDGNALEASGAYITNPEKTDSDLIAAYECDPHNAHTDFLMSKQEYTAKTGRKYKGDVLAYHVRQSFKPGEITPEKANEVGYDLAMRWTKGNHAFVVATHTDKSHIHNHIIFDAVSIDCERKFRNFWGSSKALRRLSDLICIENGLSVIENPKQSRVHYGEWLENNQAIMKPTVRENLERIIADALSKKPDSFESLTKLLCDAGCEVKQGKHLSIKAPGQKKFIRLRSLSAGFSEDAIRQKIAGKHMLMAIRKAKSIVTSAEKFDFRLDAVRGKELRDMTVGVVGTGHIGKAVIDRLHGFGCRVLAYNRSRDAGCVQLNELLERSDIVTLHAPLNKDTYHMLGREQIESMKRGAFLVNTGRGALVDTNELIKALETGKLGGAALDVLEGEEGFFYFDCTQKPIDNQFLLRLQRMPNVIITPHTAYYTSRALYDTVEKTILNCLDFERSQRHE